MKHNCNSIRHIYRIQNCFESVIITILALRVTYKSIGLVAMLVRTEEITDIAMEDVCKACPAGRFLGVCWHQKEQKESEESSYAGYITSGAVLFFFVLVRS